MVQGAWSPTWAMVLSSSRRFCVRHAQGWHPRPPSDSAEMSMSSVRISMHRPAYSLTVGSTLSAITARIFYCSVGNQIADSARRTAISPVGVTARRLAGYGRGHHGNHHEPGRVLSMAAGLQSCPAASGLWPTLPSCPAPGRCLPRGPSGARGRWPVRARAAGARSGGRRERSACGRSRGGRGRSRGDTAGDPDLGRHRCQIAQFEQRPYPVHMALEEPLQVAG